MTTATSAETTNGWSDRFWRIPPERILMQPAPGTATEADAMAVAEASNKRLCELVDGILVEKAMGNWESQVAVFISGALLAFVRERKLGAVTGSDGPYRLAAGSVRMPDVAYISRKRLVGERPLKNWSLNTAPELAVEVLSKSNTAAEMIRKREDYFKAGVLLVWEIDPVARTVRIERADRSTQMLTETDELTGEEVLPGFTLQLREVFSVLDDLGD